MRGWILALGVLCACTIDSTGLLPPDTGVRVDARLRRDAGTDEDATLGDTAPPDVSVVDVPIADMGPADVPVDTPPDVQVDAFEGGPTIPAFCADPGLVVCYLFDGDVLDSSLNVQHLTDLDVTYTDDGAVDGAVVIDVASRLSLPGVRFDLGIEFTVELWFRMEQAIPGEEVRWIILDVDGVMRVNVNKTDDSGVSRAVAGLLDRQVGMEVSTGGWHHLVAVSRASAVALTIDGGVTRERSGEASSTPPGDLHIGSTSGFRENFIGDIDHLRIWDRALSEPEVTALFTE